MRFTSAFDLIFRNHTTAQPNCFSPSDITTNGFPAFDCVLKQEVLVTTVVLCFLGDSPMHAEITNTPLPGASLNPCRICHLGVSKRIDKSGEDYIYQFLAMDSLGNRVCIVFDLDEPCVVTEILHCCQNVVDYRDWNETIERSHNLWDTAVKDTNKKYTDDSRALGVQDVINRGFVEILYDKRKQSEVPKIMALAEHQHHELFNPFLRLLGKFLLFPHPPTLNFKF